MVGSCARELRTSRTGFGNAYVLKVKCAIVTPAKFKAEAAQKFCCKDDMHKSGSATFFVKTMLADDMCRCYNIDSCCWDPMA